MPLTTNVVYKLLNLIPKLQFYKSGMKKIHLKALSL